MAAPRKTAPLVDESAAPTINIDRIGTQTILVPIVGTSPLIVHNFSAKAKQQMLDAQQGRKKVKQTRDPEVEYESSFYKIYDEATGTEKPGFPIVAFKAATISAARYYDKSVSMTGLRQLLFMHGLMTKADPQQLVEIVGTPQMREDVVRLGGPSRSADLRYRAEFPEWSATLKVTFVTSGISQQSVLSLIDAGGMGVGVGEWRPERKGEFGTYRIDDDKGISIVG